MSYNKELSLAEKAAEELLEMITVEKKFCCGEKLPNENKLSEMLKVSRGTLREAIRILVTQDVLHIQRGKGTYITENESIFENRELNGLFNVKVGLGDLMEIRLINEPYAAFLAAKRATKEELEKILYYGQLNEEKILKGEDRTEEERLFHNAISKATHNEFMKKLMPIINEGIYKGVILSKELVKINETTLEDHRLIMDFLRKRDANGAKLAMELHILRAIDCFGIKSQTR